MTELAASNGRVLKFQARIMKLNHRSCGYKICLVTHITVDTDPLYYVKPSDRVFSFERINVQEVVNLVKGIDGGKATGLDNIPCKLLKIAADVVAPSLTCIFNQSLLTGIYPSDWKLAKVTAISKNGSKTDLNNYRPISVIPAVAKIFEKIIYDHLYNYINVNDLLTSCQSGFRSLHSTLTALLETSNNWCVNVDKGLLNGVIFIDLKKAFDTIDHEITLQKLAKYGVDQDALKWFKYSKSSTTMQRKQSPLQYKPFKLWSSPRINNWHSTLFDLYK